jgi:hypothetical protein
VNTPYNALTDARTAHTCKDEKKHIRTKEKKKSKVDKKDDVTIVLFLFYFPNYIVRPSTKKRQALVYYGSSQYFLGERKFLALKKETGPYNLPYISRQRKINAQHCRHT